MVVQHNSSKKRQQTISGAFGNPRRVVTAAKDLNATSRSRTVAPHNANSKQQSQEYEIDQYKYLPLLDQSDPTPPIHEVNMSIVDKVLRQFDLNRDFGPAAGLTRLARWDRANKLGKNPPDLLRELLVEVSDTKKYSVFGVL